MNRIDELVAELCPAGVPVRTMGEIGELVRGNGMPKTDLTETGVGAIHYGQIYTYYGTWTTETISFVSPSIAKRLAKVDPGDIIITNTSENLSDVGKAVAWLGDQQIVTGGHATVLKHDQDPRFVAYWLQSPSFQKQKRRLAAGTKVIDVSAKKLASVKMPVPPLAIQREVAAILDGLKDLQSELELALDSESAMRSRAYVYHRDLLFETAAEEDALLRPLGEIYDSSSGLSKSADQFGFGQPFLSFKTVFNNPVVPAELSNRVNSTLSEQSRYSIKAGDVFVTRTSEDLEGLGMSCAALSDYPGATFNGFTKRLRPKESGVIDPSFAGYFFRSAVFRKQIARMAILSTRVSLNDNILSRIRIPVPAIEEQRSIVAVLDRFNSLTNELLAGIPAEITARRQQYGHYRDQLLTFEEAGA